MVLWFPAPVNKKFYKKQDPSAAFNSLPDKELENISAEGRQNVFKTHFTKPGKMGIVSKW